MKRRSFQILTVLTLCIISQAPSQSEVSNAFFLNANVGEYFALFPLSELPSRSNITYGGGIGVQFSNHIIVGAKLAYFSHTGIPLVHYYDSNENGHLIHDGVSKYEQWFYLISLQYKIVNEEYFMASVGGGIIFSKMKEINISTTYEYYSENHSNDIKGGFLGGELELRIPNQPFSVVGDIQLGYSTGDRSYIEGVTNTEAFSGFNLSIGIRYYILF